MKTRKTIWSDAFRISPKLRSYEADAVQFLSEIELVEDARHKIAHALFGSFSKGPPISVRLIKIKRSKNSAKPHRGIEYFTSSPLTIDDIKHAAQKASDLNIKLYALSSLLQGLMGSPSSNVEIVSNRVR
jgi:hypothetical protein